MLTSLRGAVGRFVDAHYGCAVDLSARSLAAGRSLDDARAFLDNASAMPAGRLPWCSRCGERLRVRDERGAQGRDGIHARCYGG